MKTVQSQNHVHLFHVHHFQRLSLFIHPILTILSTTHRKNGPSGAWIHSDDTGNQSSHVAFPHSLKVRRCPGTTQISQCEGWGLFWNTINIYSLKVGDCPETTQYFTVWRLGTALKQHNILQFEGWGLPLSNTFYSLKVGDCPETTQYFTVWRLGTALKQHNILQFEGWGLLSKNTILYNFKVRNSPKQHEFQFEGQGHPENETTQTSQS